MGFLTRGDAVTIFGRRIPVSVLAVAATLIGAYLVLRARKAGANVAAVGTPAASTALGTAAPAAVSSTYDPNAAAISQLNQSQNDLLGQLQQIQTQLATQSSTAPAASGPTIPAVGALSGSGYYPPTGQTTETSGQGTYEYLGTWSQVTALQAAGQTVYLQPSPGVFVPWTGPSSAAPGTPLYSYTPLAPKGGGGIKGSSSTISAYGWSSRGPVRGRVRSSAFRGTHNPLAAAA